MIRYLEGTNQTPVLLDECLPACEEKEGGGNIRVYCTVQLCKSFDFIHSSQQ